MRWASALQLLPTAWRVRLPLLLLGTVLMAMLALSGLEGALLARRGGQRSHRPVAVRRIHRGAGDLAPGADPGLCAAGGQRRSA